MKKLLLILLLFAPTIRATDYIDSTAGAVQQALLCDGCGIQVGAANYFLSMITPANSGTLDSMRVRSSNNYGADVKAFGVLFADQSNSIGAFVARSFDSCTSNSNLLATKTLKFSGGVTLTASTVYYLGVVTDSANATSMRFANTDNVANRTGSTLTGPQLAWATNYTTAGYAQWENQGVGQIYVIYYYHSGSPATPTSTVIRGSVIRGSVIR